MILRRLVVAGDRPLVVDLHPRLTVVTGLGEEGRARVVDAVTAFLRGDVSRLSGIVSIDGAEFDIEPDVLDLLELPVDVPNVVIRAGDLNRAWARADQKDVTTSGRPAELEPELEQLDRRFGFVAPDREGFGDLMDRPEPEGWAWTTPDPLVTDEAGPTDDRSARIAEIETEIDEIHRRLAELDDPADLPSGAGTGTGTAWDAAPTAGPARIAVSAALEAFRWVRSWRPDAPPDAVAVAERIAELRREQALARRDDVPEWLREQSRQQLEEARTEMERAEREVRPPRVPADAAEALEAAHTAVDEAEERANRRMAGPIAARRLAAARAHEEEILARLGLPSYAAFLLLRASSGNVDADGERRLAAARDSLADAEAMWAEVSGEGGADMEALREREREVRAQALEVLGPEAAIAVSEITLDRLEQLLREQRMPAPDWQPAAEGLVEALQEAGAEVPPLAFDDDEGEVDYDRLDDFASRWLDNVAADVSPELDERLHDAERVRAALQADLEHLERTLVDLRDAEAEAAGAPAGFREPEPYRWDEPEAADEIVVEEVAVDEFAVDDQAYEPFEVDVVTVPEADPEPEPEPEPERPLSAVERLRLLRDQTSAQLDALAAEVTSLTRGDFDRPVEPVAETIEDRGDETVEDPADDGPVDDTVDGISGFLTEQFDAVRAVGAAGALPILFDEILEGQPQAVADALFARVAEESQTVQVVMLGDDARAIEWAAALGDAAVVDAAVVDAGPHGDLDDRASAPAGPAEEGDLGDFGHPYDDF